ncbi:MAG: cupin domain-containing protein [Candidatus Eisenbacteria bacterium]|uniref:Cupin domain-containing protein n=1 Tax=Eiseniibacteriota bacterium TaxID=2212470 RepID=A0A937XEK3_UNCEI|nr:cupin domain-containing protein [Candidatus Eisenbacteria bacterium]
MRISKDQIPAKISVPGAVARVAPDFGDATGFGKMGGEYFSLGAGTDIAPLLKGLEDDACQAPHWGYMLSGEVVVTYTDGKVETCKGGDLFHWPAGHSVRVVKDAEVILFSPLREHTRVLDHMLSAMEG